MPDVVPPHSHSRPRRPAPSLEQLAPATAPEVAAEAPPASTPDAAPQAGRPAYFHADLDIPIDAAVGYVARNISVLLTPAEAAAIASLAAGLQRDGQTIAPRRTVSSGADAFRWLGQQILKAQAKRCAMTNA